MNFSFKKPIMWSSMPLFKKIAYYKDYLDERFAKYVDKIEAKKYVKKICGDEINIPKIVRILDSYADFVEADINCEHMVKACHGSGWNINMDKTTTVDSVIKRLKIWNTVFNYANEKQYKYIKPRFFIEEKIDGNIGNADVYMIRCINGNPISIRYKATLSKKTNTYNIEWEPLLPLEIDNVEKPVHLDKMLTLASKLSNIFEFVRIDFYYIDNKIYFSEFTFTPSAGHQLFSMELEMKLGSLWT